MPLWQIAFFRGVNFEDMTHIRSLRQSLTDIELARLRVIARLWGLDVATHRPLDIAVELAALMGDPVHAADVWAALPEAERDALRALLAADGMLPAAAFARRFGEIRPMGPGRLEREKPWREPVSSTEGLWYRGLIYQGFVKQGDEAYPVFFVPAELRAALPFHVEKPAHAIQLEPAPAPDNVRAAGDWLLDDLVTLLIFVHNEIVQSVGEAPGIWSEAAQQALARRLRDPDAERLAFMSHMVEHLGWVQVGEEGHLSLIPAPVMAWLKADLAPARATLQTAWRRMTEWNELWRLPTLRPDDTGTWHNDPTLARLALCRHLAAIPSGQWVRIDDFIAAIKAVAPDFQRPGGDYETWYIRDAASGDYLDGFESWDQVEGALLRALLTGPAWWLGLVALGGMAQDAPPEVFCTRASEEAVALSEVPPPLVHADLTVEMPARDPARDPARVSARDPAHYRFERFQLARVADLVSVGDPYVYRLTPTALERAQAQRIDVERVLEFLAGLSEAPLPPAVEACVTRWGERGTEAWLERTLLLQVKDVKVMQRILTVGWVNRYVARVLSPTAIIVAERDWPALVDALVELGLLVDVRGTLAQVRRRDDSSDLERDAHEH